MRIIQDNSGNRINELAPCGAYCGACPSFNKTCNGCASEDKNQDGCSKWGCKIRDCCYNIKGLDYCIYCEQFPCKLLNRKFNSHQSDPRYTYRHEVTVVFEKLKTMSLEDYFEFQKQRWKCKSCGGVVYFYHYKCNTCGKEQMIK